MPNNKYQDRRTDARSARKDGARKPVHNQNHAKPKGPSPARVAALEALMDVQIADAYAGLALTRRIAAAKLNALDRRLMTELFYGVLENRIYLDYILSKYMQRPCEDDVTLQILRMGVYQLVMMDRIPENAACNDAVELVKCFKRGSMTGLVNAVLRGIVRERSRIALPENEMERISVEYSFPKWLAEKLTADFGMDFAKALMSYRDKQHSAVIRPNLTQITCEAFEKYMTEQGFEWEHGKVPGAYAVKGGFVSQHVGFRTGRYSIMGEASMLAAQAVGVKPGWQVLDCCAAPGGKTCYLAEAMNGTGRVYSWDLHEHRVKLIAGAAQRLHLDNVRPRVQDARESVESQMDRMDCVLVDAPCSGMGDYISKPDIKYHVTEQGIASLHETQCAILDTVCKYVKPGGTLVYSTCTIFREENEQTVLSFLETHPEFELKGLDKHLPEPFAGQVQNGMLTLYPHLSGTDGFFIARMERKKRI